MRKWISNIINAVLNIKPEPPVAPDHLQVIKNKRNKIVASVNHSLYGSAGIILSIVMAYLNTQNLHHSAFTDFSQYVSYASYPLTYGIVHVIGSVLTLFKPVKYALATPGIILSAPYLIKCHKDIKMHNSNGATNCKECLSIAKQHYELYNNQG